MILLWLIVILLAGGVLAWLAARWRASLARWIALAACALDLALSLGLWARGGAGGRWMQEVSALWVPQFGIRFHLAVDGLSLLMLMLTFFLGALSVLASWSEIEEGVGFFHWNLMWILAGITGVFVAVDLFLFYFMWELMLVPMYFLIAIWGHENRVYAAVKFFLFTQITSLLMLVAILALYFINHARTGVYSFDYPDLLGVAMAPHVEMVIMLGFFIAFAVKLPMFPLHPWLPDAHTEAPTAGSVILAGLLLKTGAYGMIRFVAPLFPRAADAFAPAAMWLGVAGIIYGAVLAFGQTDLKRLVAYTSVSHLGFVLVGIFSGNALAFQGAVVTMICHGVSTGGLFVLVGALQERIHTREMARMGGLWSTIPYFSGAAMFFALASLGLPGLGDFVGEFLVLIGSFRANAAVGCVATAGVLFATFYALRFVQRAFQGPNESGWSLPDLRPREALIAGSMMLVLLWLGTYPRPVIDTLAPSEEQIRTVALR
ncbi:MAG: NADH-quinone oxidoreductase subunit M [Bryobacteraceae bacterium]